MRVICFNDVHNCYSALYVLRQDFTTAFVGETGCCSIVCLFSFQGFELMLLSLGDPSERVVNAVHQVFIPAFAAWTTELGTLHTSLIPSLLARIEKLHTVSVFHFSLGIVQFYICTVSLSIICAASFSSKENMV